jgi:cell wall-associated NlpC family hydrolase
LIVISACLFFSANLIAQSSEADSPKTTSTVYANGGAKLQSEAVALPSAEEGRPRTVTAASVVVKRAVAPVINLSSTFDKSLLTAIQSHVGAEYHFNRTGPEEFDCSGLVWRAFQDVGVNFQRGPARSYWATFAAPPKDEQFKFGTLVFFSNLSHVGIVVDDKGFYHSARHGGVMYSPFNDYWLSRVDGFRRVPIEELQSLPGMKKTTAVKSITAAEQNNQR